MNNKTGSDGALQVQPAGNKYGVQKNNRLVRIFLNFLSENNTMAYCPILTHILLR